MSEFTKDPSTHPAHCPLTEERLIRVRDELAAAAKRSDGGNLGYMMADAAKAIDELLALRKVEQEPVCHLTWHQGFRAPDDCEDYVIVAKPSDVSCDGSPAFPVYAAPQLPQPAVAEKAITPPAYEIKRFGEFGANGLTRDDGELAISIQLFHFERGTTPQPVRGGGIVEKYALQAIINALQQQCDRLSDAPIPVIWPAAPQQEVKP